MAAATLSAGFGSSMRQTGSAPSSPSHASIHAIEANSETIACSAAGNTTGTYGRLLPRTPAPVPQSGSFELGRCSGPMRADADRRIAALEQGFELMGIDILDIRARFDKCSRMISERPADAGVGEIVSRAEAVSCSTVAAAFGPHFEEHSKRLNELEDMVKQTNAVLESVRRAAPALSDTVVSGHGGAVEQRLHEATHQIQVLQAELEAQDLRTVDTCSAVIDDRLARLSSLDLQPRKECNSEKLMEEHLNQLTDVAKALEEKILRLRDRVDEVTKEGAVQAAQLARCDIVCQWYEEENGLKAFGQALRDLKDLVADQHEAKLKKLAKQHESLEQHFRDLEERTAAHCASPLGSAAGSEAAIGDEQQRMRDRLSALESTVKFALQSTSQSAFSEDQLRSAIDNRISSLGLQAKLQEHVRSSSAEVKQHIEQILRTELSSTSSMLQRVSEQHNSVSENTAILQQEVSNLSKSLEEVTDSMVPVSEEVVLMRGELTTLSEKFRILQQMTQRDADSAIASISAEIAKHSQELNALTASVQSIQAFPAEVTGLHETVVEQLKEVSVDNVDLRKQFNGISQKMDGMTATIQSFSNEPSSASDIASLHKKFASLSQSVKAIEEQRGELVLRSELPGIIQSTRTREDRQELDEKEKLHQKEVHDEQAKRRVAYEFGLIEQSDVMILKLAFSAWNSLYAESMREHSRTKVGSASGKEVNALHKELSQVREELSIMASDVIKGDQERIALAQSLQTASSSFIETASGELDKFREELSGISQSLRERAEEHRMLVRRIEPVFADDGDLSRLSQSVEARLLQEHSEIQRIGEQLSIVESRTETHRELNKGLEPLFSQVVQLPTLQSELSRVSQGLQTLTVQVQNILNTSSAPLDTSRATVQADASSLEARVLKQLSSLWEQMSMISRSVEQQTEEHKAFVNRLDLVFSEVDQLRDDSSYRLLAQSMQDISGREPGLSHADESSDSVSNVPRNLEQSFEQSVSKCANLREEMIEKFGELSEALQHQLQNVLSSVEGKFAEHQEFIIKCRGDNSKLDQRFESISPKITKLQQEASKLARGLEDKAEEQRFLARDVREMSKGIEEGAEQHRILVCKVQQLANQYAWQCIDRGSPAPENHIEPAAMFLDTTPASIPEVTAKSLDRGTACTGQDSARDDHGEDFVRSRQLVMNLKEDVMSRLEAHFKTMLCQNEDIVQLRADHTSVAAIVSRLASHIDNGRSGFTDTDISILEPKARVDEARSTAQLSEALADLRNNFSTFTAAATSQQSTLESKVAKAVGEFATLSKDFQCMQKEARSSPRKNAEQSSAIMELRNEILGMCPDMGCMTMELYALSQRIEKQVSNMFSAEERKLAAKFKECQDETAAVEQRLSDRIKTCGEKAETCISIERKLNQHLSDTTAKAECLIDFEKRVEAIESEALQHDSISGLEQRMEAIEGAECERVSFLAAAGFQKSSPMIPPRQTTQTPSPLAQGSSRFNLAQRVTKIEAAIKAGENKQIEEAFSQLVTGILKMLQMLGIINDDSTDKLEGWREVCADLPRILDHAWLRLRLPKRTTVLKLLRQKADAEHVRELQVDVETLFASTRGLGLFPMDTDPAPPAVPTSSKRAASLAPSVTVSVTAPQRPSSAGTRRPSSAGRRFAGAAMIRCSGESDIYAPLACRDAWAEAC